MKNNVINFYFFRLGFFSLCSIDQKNRKFSGSYLNLASIPILILPLFSQLLSQWNPVHSYIFLISIISIFRGEQR